MSADAVAYVYKYSPYDGATQLVLLALADVVNDERGNVYYGAHATLAAKARVTRRTAQRALSKLMDDGWLKAVRRQGVDQCGGTNCYEFIADENRPVVYQGRDYSNIQSDGRTKRRPQDSDVRQDDAPSESADVRHHDAPSEAATVDVRHCGAPSLDTDVRHGDAPSSERATLTTRTCDIDDTNVRHHDAQNSIRTQDNSRTPFVDPASGDDRRDATNADRLFPTTDLPGEPSKKRVPVNHDGETLWFDSEAEAVFGLWVRLHGKQASTVFSDGRKEKVKAALSKIGLARCLDAVRGNALSEWHQGDNEAGRKYDDLLNIFRNATTIDQAEIYWNDPPKRQNGYSRLAKNGRAQRCSLATPLPTAADFGDDDADAEKDMVRNAYRTGYDEARRNQPDASDAAWQEHGKARARQLREKLAASK